MMWLAPKAGSNGRPLVFSNAAIQFCLMVKVLFGLPLRQTTGMVASILSMAGLDWPVPDFSTLSRRQKTIEVQITLSRATGPLNLLVDSTGIKFLGDWGVAGAQAWHTSPTPVSQGASGDGHSHRRYLRGGIHLERQG